MRKYIDEKMFVTLILVGVTLFFLQHWLSKKVIDKDGKLNVFVGHKDIGHAQVA